MSTDYRLTFRKIFFFWSPLAATWLMMAVEGPFLAAIIARLVDPKFNLAAYGVAYAFALTIEAPIIMIMSTSTALVDNRNAFFKTRNFIYTLNGLTTVLILLLLIPPVFKYIAQTAIGLPEPVARLAYQATCIFIPWSGAIGYRRFYQGILIRHNLTRRVAYGTVIRLVSMAGTALLLYHFTSIPGALVGASALVAGVIMEAAVSRIMVAKTLGELMNNREIHTSLTYRYLIKFYIPLALTSVLALGVHPLLTFFMGHSRAAIESLAVWPVIYSFVFIFRSVGLSYQEACISLLGRTWNNFKSIYRFGTVLFILVISTMSLIVFTPALEFWLSRISGLSTQLSLFATLPLQILIFIPGSSVLLSLQRSILVIDRRTTPITWATVIEISGIFLTLYLTIFKFEMVGVTAAAIAVTIGRIGANLFLLLPCYRIIIKIKNTSS